MKLRPYSSTLLALCGFILMGTGFYFVFLRPPLLPEDMRYLDTSLPTIQRVFPHLLLWLHRVFWVMGAFMFTSGVLKLYIARTSFRKRAPGVGGLMTLAGITSLGWMTVVNFLLGSDFTWFLTAVAVRPMGTGVAAVLVEKVAPTSLSSSLLPAVAAGMLRMGRAGKTLALSR